MGKDTTRILGLGGGGIDVVNRLCAIASLQPLTVAVDTDAQALETSAAAVRLQVAPGRLRGRGCGGDVELARQAVEDDAEKLSALCHGVSQVFLIAGFGGGFGGGAGPAVLEAAAAAGSAAVGLATLPFAFEGRQRRTAADRAVDRACEAAHALIVVPNERLFDGVGETRVPRAFEQAGNVLAGGAAGLCRMLVEPGYIRLGAAELQRAFQAGGAPCAMGFGEGSGRERADTAVNALLGGPLLERGELLEKARALLVSIMAGEDLALREVGRIMERITGRARPDCEILVGTVVAETRGTKLTVTAVVSEHARRAAPRERPSGEGEARSGEGPLLRQADLRFEPVGRGRFKDVEPTILDGQDLDIPAYRRRGIRLER